MKSDREKYEGMTLPVRRAVESWASFHDVHVRATGTRWMLDRHRPYDMERPPPRFVDADAVQDIHRRVRRIEREVAIPSLRPPLERKVRSLLAR